MKTILILSLMAVPFMSCKKETEMDAAIKKTEPSLPVFTIGDKKNADPSSWKVKPIVNDFNRAYINYKEPTGDGC